MIWPPSGRSLDPVPDLIREVTTSTTASVPTTNG
jgi:hypothetical protein